MDDEYFEASCSENSPFVDEPQVPQVKDILTKRFDSLKEAYQLYKRDMPLFLGLVCVKVATDNLMERSFEESHNHDLVPDHQKCFIHSNRNVTEADLAEAKLLRVAGVKTCQVMNVFAHQYGGFGKVGFMSKDLYNNISTECKLEIRDGDAMATFMYFDVKNDASMDIYYRFTVDGENRLEHLFWCDGMCRYDYACFGDVLAFDTTYKKNSYNRPLLVFLGVNNHHQIVVFGYALLANEKANAFCWVLNTLMDAMANKKPISVITDGDKAMDRAVRYLNYSFDEMLSSP